MNQKWLLRSAFVAPAVLILLVFMLRPDPSKERIRRFEKNVQAAGARWTKSKPIAVEEITRSHIDAASLTNRGVVITSEQEKLLRDLIYLAYQCYGGTNFEGYRRFRLGIPYTLDTNELNDLQLVSIRHDSTPEDQLSVAWRERNGTNRLTALAPESITITSLEWTNSYTNEIRVLYNQAKVEIPGVAVAVFPSLINTIPSARDVLKQDGKLLCASVRQIVQLDGGPPKKPLPLYFTFWWCAERSIWIPLEMGLLVRGQYKTIL